MNEHDAFAALSNPTRRDILRAMKTPATSFSQSGDGDARNGVCVSAIQARTGLSQSTVSAYMAALHRAGLVKAERRGQWTFYQRDEEGIATFRRTIVEEL